MLKVLHLLGNEPHESVQRNIYDESVFMLRHGVDVRFIYDPSAQSRGDKAFIEELRTLGALMYKMPYLPREPKTRSKKQHKRKNSGGGEDECNEMSTFLAAMTLREICAKHEIDVVHTHTEPAFRIACTSRFLGAQAAHIFTAHAIATRTPSENLFVRLITLWCDEIIAVDNYTAGVLLDRMIRAAKIKRVNYGIDLDKWKLIYDENALTHSGDISMALKAARVSGDNATRGSGENTAGVSGEEAARARNSIWARNGGSARVKSYNTEKVHSGESVYASGGQTVNARNDESVYARSGDAFTILLIADSDELIKGQIFDTFSEVILRLMHDFNPTLSKFKRLRFIISTNSKMGIDYSNALIGSLDLADDVEVTGLSASEGILEAGRIHSLGQAPEASRLSLYRRSDMCLYYSENRFFPYAAAEAIAMDIPTITNDITFFVNISLNILPEDKSADDGKSDGKGDKKSDGKGDGKGDSKSDGKGDDTGGAIDKNDAGDGESIVDSDRARDILAYSQVDFSKPDAVAQRVLTLIYDNQFRNDFMSIESQTVRERYNIEDMIIGIYDSYVRGFRV